MTPLATSILVVDDDHTVRRTLTRVLQRAGYGCVESACSGTTALDILAKTPVDLVLTDLEMPDGSGLELLHHLQAEMHDIASLMITGNDDTDLAEKALDLGAYGYIIKPFRSSEVLIGVSNALRRRDLELESRNHRAILEHAVAKRTTDLERAVSQLELTEIELRSSRTETIERLAIAAEFRDEETGSHVARMSRYCGLLAVAAGAADDESPVREASSLHDVGKIAIPDSILLKPSTLSPSEWSVMQSHAEIGHRILSGSSSPLLSLAAEIALHHHEKFDGTGYPNRLAGSDIPVIGRIAAITDVFDALTSGRVYRKAFPVAVAVNMMKRESGKHFDEELLDLFWTLMPQVLSIQEETAAGAPKSADNTATHSQKWEELR